MTISDDVKTKSELTIKRVLLILLPIAVLISLPVAYLVIDLKQLNQIIAPTQENKVSYLDNLYQKTLDGDPNAMFRMGNNYKYGYNGLEVDLNKAIEWYQKAIEHGDSDAMNSLGLMYRHGEGVEQDYEKAISLFNKAIELENFYAYSNLGVMYKKGEGVKQDYETAFGLFKSCSERDEISAYCLGNLGWLYHDGLGTAQDYEKAFSSWLVAAKLGNAAAQFQIGYFYDIGKGHIEKDRLKAYEWYKKAAKQGYAEAQRFIGFIYLDGINGVPQNFLEAGRYFDMAARNGSKNAQKIIDFNTKKCAAWDRKASLKSCSLAVYSGNSIAMHRVSRFYYLGKYKSGIDFKKALEWQKKAALHGYSKDKYYLAKAYAKGEMGAKKNLIEAYAWASLVIQDENLSDGVQRLGKELKDNLILEMTKEDIENGEILLQKYNSIQVTKVE